MMNGGLLWQTVSFDIAPEDLIPLGADPAAVLMEVNILRILDRESPDGIQGDQLEGMLTFDNVTAGVIPEPTTALLLTMGLGALAYSGRRATPRGSTR